jgi:hypothetical protein
MYVGCLDTREEQADRGTAEKHFAKESDSSTEFFSAAQRDRK